MRLSASGTLKRSALTEPKLYAYRVPATPAISALIPKAISLTLRTSIAAPAAARRDHQEGEEHGGRERHPAEHGARQVAVQAPVRRARPEIGPEELRVRN